jgi:hypothetical protein
MSPWFDEPIVLMCAECHCEFERWMEEPHWNVCSECRAKPLGIAKRALADCLGYLEKQLRGSV